jgi:hypothetical protein
MSDLDDEDDYRVWVCICGELVDGDYDCPQCGGDPPWGCTDDACERHHGPTDDEWENDPELEGT